MHVAIAVARHDGCCRLEVYSHPLVRFLEALVPTTLCRAVVTHPLCFWVPVWSGGWATGGMSFSTARGAKVVEHRQQSCKGAVALCPADHKLGKAGTASVSPEARLQFGRAFCVLLDCVSEGQLDAF